MSSVQEIVTVTITKATAGVQQAGFGIAMVLGTHKHFNERIRFYSGTAGMVLDGFTATEAEFLKAQSYFSQNPSPLQIGIGRRTVDQVILTVTEATDSFKYTTTINGTEFSFTATVPADTPAIIALALVTAINAGSEPVTATDNADGTFDLDADTPGVAYTVSFSDKITQGALVTVDTITADLTAVQQEDDTWFGIILITNTTSDITDTAAFAAAAEAKFFFALSSEAIIASTTPASDTTSVAALLKASTFDDTTLFFHKSIANTTNNVDAATAGLILPKTPGSYTVANQTLVGVAAQLLTTTEVNNIEGKNANTFREIGGVNIVRQGQVSSGEFIDVTIFIDFLQARMAENVFAILVANDKIPFTDSGIASVENQVTAVLTEGVNNGGITTDTPFTVTVPKAADVSQTDKNNRILRDVKFTAVLAGAIHNAIINGTVTV